MKNPAHPGALVKHDCIKALNLSVQEAASILGVHRTTLSRVINGRGPISPEMAIRLAKAFGSTAEAWMRMQHAYDLTQIREKTDSIHVERYVWQPPPPSATL